MSDLVALALILQVDRVQPLTRRGKETNPFNSIKTNVLSELLADGITAVPNVVSQNMGLLTVIRERRQRETITQESGHQHLKGMGPATKIKKKMLMTMIMLANPNY